MGHTFQVEAGQLQGDCDSHLARTQLGNPLPEINTYIYIYIRTATIHTNMVRLGVVTVKRSNAEWGRGQSKVLTWYTAMASYSPSVRTISLASGGT